MTRRTPDMPIHVNVLVEPQEDCFVAHCLELDIVATGDSADAAFRDVIDLILAQLEYAVANDNMEHFFNPAPPEAWSKLAAIRDKSPKCTYERVQEPIAKTGKRTPFERLEADRYCYA